MVKQISIWTISIAALLLVLFLGFVYFASYHPDDAQTEPIACNGEAPVLKSGQKIKVLSWNVQYMAGKNYVFFYDLLDNSGPDERPSKEDITKTFKEVARIINDENPDIILIQELDDGADRTDNEDQLARLLPMISDEYRCSTSAFYWKAAFVPHPRIMGSAGMKLSTISKYAIAKAIRVQLELIPADFVTQQFNLKRAVLAAHFPVEGKKEFVALNTHLDAFAQGTDTMQKQVQQVSNILEGLNNNRFPWIIGGDFNLLMPGKAYKRLPEKQRAYFLEKTELEKLTSLYKSVPSLDEVNGRDFKKWFTHYPNDPAVQGPDRTIDYIFFSNGVRVDDHYVRQKDTLHISDHLPVIVEITIP